MRFDRMLLQLAIIAVVSTQMTPAIAQSSPEPGDFAAREHFFPLFADGAGFQSHLFLTNLADVSNRCELVLRGPGLGANVFLTSDALVVTGTGAFVELSGIGAAAALKSAGGSAATFGNARLECSDPISARMLLTLNDDDTPVSMAALEGAVSGSSLQFPVLPELGRLAIVVSGELDSNADCAAKLVDAAGMIIDSGDIAVPASATGLRFLDEFITVPDDLQAGLVELSCDREVAALALPLRGAVFAALPPAVLPVNTVPAFAREAGPGVLTFTQGESVDGVLLPEATGGNGNLVYSLTPAVPGLLFDSATRVLGGAPTETGKYTMSYTATDTDGDSQTIRFAIEVGTKPSDAQPAIFMAGDTIFSLPGGGWSPDILSGGSSSSSEGVATIELDDGGYIEESGNRYVCHSADGCSLRNRDVRSGTILRLAKRAVPENIPPWQFASAWPDRIVQTFSGDPARTITVTWRTDSSVQSTQAQIAPASPGPRFDRDRRSMDAATEALYLSTAMVNGVPLVAPDNVGLGKVHYHSVVFRELQPDTLYAYRVQGADGNWSEWYQTRTAPESGPVKFVYFGDAQNGILSHWSRVIRAAFMRAPDARFFLHAGDLVDTAARDFEWAEWFKAGGFVHGSLPAVVVVGNHELQRYGIGEQRSGSVLSHMWRPQFTLPVDSSLPASLHETVYEVHYNKDIHLFVLNSLFDFGLQVEWLDRQLTESNARWKILSMHFPIFASAEGRSDGSRRDLLLPVLKKHRVDLVLQGHDHTYARGAIGQSPERIAMGEGDGVEVMFVNSVSGAKMYSLKADGWDGSAEYGLRLHRAAENTQFYQVISIDGSRLIYETWTADDQLYDYFEMVKGANGLKSLSKGKRQTLAPRRFSNTND